MVLRFMIAVIVITLWLTVPARANECTAWYSAPCWAKNLQDLIDSAKDIPDAMKQYSDKALAGVYQAGVGLSDVAGKAGGVLQQTYGKLVEGHDKVCADDDLFFVEAVSVIAAGIFAVEVAMTGGVSGGAGTLALKGLLISQSPALMSKLHQRLCGTPYTKVDASLVTQVESVIDKTLSGK